MLAVELDELHARGERSSELSPDRVIKLAYFESINTQSNCSGFPRLDKVHAIFEKRLHARQEEIVTSICEGKIHLAAVALE
jgi:hypothetical protein